MRVAIDDLWVGRDGSPTKRHGRGNRYRVRWTESTGLGPRVRTASFANKKKRDAESFRDSLLASVRLADYRAVEGGMTLFAELAALYVTARRDLKPSSRSKLEDTLKRWLLPRWGKMQIREIHRTIVEKWVDDLRSGVAPTSSSKASAGLAASSTAYVVTQFSAILRHAVSLDMIARNPASGVALEKPEPSANRALTRDEVRSLAKEAGRFGAESNKTLVMFLALTGVRISEALAIRVEDVNLRTRRVAIERTWTDVHGVPQLGTPKSGKARRVAYPSVLDQAIVSLMAGNVGPKTYLFRAPRGGPWTRRNWSSRIWRPAARACWPAGGAPSPHVMRRTFATWAVASGADVRVIQNQLGHASPSITLDVYADLWADNLDTVADRLGQVWNGA